MIIHPMKKKNSVRNIHLKLNLEELVKNFRDGPYENVARGF